MSLPEFIPSALPQYAKLNERADFSSSVVGSGHVLVFAESSGGDVHLTAKNPDGTYTEIGGGSGGIITSDGNITSDAVLSGYIGYNSSGRVAGGIPSVASSSYVVGSGGMVLSGGVYLSGDQTFTASAGGEDIKLGVLVDGGTAGILFQELAFSGTSASDSGVPVSMGDNIRTWNTGHPAPVPEGGMPDVYKCASVDTTNHTWTGYLATTDEYGTTTFASATTDLTYSCYPIPVVGRCYTEDGFNEVIVSEVPGRNGLIFYGPLHTTKSTAETGQTYTVVGRFEMVTEKGVTGMKRSKNADYVTIQDTGFPEGDHDRSISVFVYPYNLNDTYPRVFSYGTMSSGEACVLNAGYDGCAGMEYWGEECRSGPLSTNTWQHIVGVLDSGVTKIYINGELANSKTIPVNTILSGVAKVGYCEKGFDGLICEVKVWERVLSQDEITAEYTRLQAMVQA